MFLFISLYQLFILDQSMFVGRFVYSYLETPILGYLFYHLLLLDSILGGQVLSDSLF